MLFLLTVCKLHFLLVESPFLLDQSQLLKSIIDDYIHANRWRLSLMIWKNKGRFRIPTLVLVVLVRFLWGPCETAIISPKIILRNHAIAQFHGMGLWGYQVSIGLLAMHMWECLSIFILGWHSMLEVPVVFWRPSKRWTFSGKSLVKLCVCVFAQTQFK